MKNIIAINTEIEKICNPNIIFYEEYQNILVNGCWVTEIDEIIYTDTLKKIKKKITNLADLSNPNKLLYFKIFRQEILEIYKNLTSLNYDKLDVITSNLEYSNSFFYSNEVPKLTSREFIINLIPIKNYKFDDILDYTGILYNIDEWFTSEVRSGVDDDIDILEYLEEKLSPLIIGNQKDEDLKFEKHYSYALLGDQLMFYRELIRLIAEHTEKIYLFINKIENKEESVLGLEDIYDNDPNNVKLEFKISKKEIAILFKNLYDFEIFHVDNKGFRDDYTQLKKYINNANMYFPRNGKLEPVKGITKEFSKVYGKEERIMHQGFEKKFLKSLVVKLTERIKEIDSEKE
jgi:hypothetical protein